MCDFAHCPAPSTRRFRCVVCGLELFACDVHAPPPDCPVCGAMGAIAPAGTLSSSSSSSSSTSVPIPPSKVVQTVVDDRATASSSDTVTVGGSTTPCRLHGDAEMAWCEDTTGLVLSVEICPGVTVTIGHSFGAMAAREAYLREEAGTTMSGGSASGPNNALCELRILLVNEHCKALQIAVRFRDAAGRHLLFRSTGGSVLQQDPADPAKTIVRNHRCLCTASDGYLADETFVHAGSYSFFDQIADAVNEPRLMTAQQYVAHHESTYRELVEASTNAQLFHHSEQAIYKLLFDYPNVVADAIDVVQRTSHHTFFNLLAKPPLVAALVVDIFTTRTACHDCLKAGRSARSKAVSFFSQALKDVAKTLGSRVGVAASVRTHVRFAAAAAFTGCPSKGEIAKQTATPSAAMMHALPSEAIPVTAPAPSEPPIVFQNVGVPVNAASCMPLLTTGSASRERTEVDIALQIARELLTISRTAHIPKAVATVKLSTDASKVMMALALWNRVAGDVSGLKTVLPNGPEVVPLAPRLETVLETAAVNKIGGTILLTILRNYRAFLEGHANMPQPFDAVAVITLVDRAARAVAMVPTMSPNAVSVLRTLLPLFAAKADVAREFVETMKAEIASALAENTATGENRALNLAIEFNLVDYYNAAKKK